MKTEQQGMLCSGDVYIDFFDSSGASTGFQLVGNAKKFAPKVETETKDNLLNGRGTLGHTGDSYTRITSSSISIVFNRYNPELLAAYFMGSAVDQTAPAGAYTASITGIMDKWVSVGVTGLSTCVVKDSSDTDTYVVDEDYEVNLRLGLIKIINEDLDGETLHISGNKAAKTGMMIKGGSRPTINVGLLLDGENNANGEDIRVEVFKAQLKADGDYDFLSEDYPELSFSGTMLTPTGKSWPFEVV